MKAKRYKVNDKGLEYLIALETITSISDEEFTSKEFRSARKRHGLPASAKIGQVWEITYHGNNQWTGIKSARLHKK